MTEPQQAPGLAENTDKQKQSPARSIGKFLLAFLVSYGLALCIATDSVFLLGIPGIIGLLTTAVMVVSKIMQGMPESIPYATDGSDPMPAVKFHHAVLCKRGLSVLLVSAAITAAALTYPPALFPLGITGMAGLMYCVWLWGRQGLLVRRCRKILGAYPLVFRTPVHKLNLRSDERRVLRLGEEKQGGSPVMSAREPIWNKQWPKDIADGVWFAGDDAFGGALLVPGTGELMCMQPKDWDELATARETADKERQARAKQAGLVRHHL